MGTDARAEIRALPLGIGILSPKAGHEAMVYNRLTELGLNRFPVWRQQGRPQEAVVLLAPILGWFKEGFDTADLKDAKALLDKLTEPAIAAEG
jgi:hypothetical protein